MSQFRYLNNKPSFKYIKQKYFQRLIWQNVTLLLSTLGIQLITAISYAMQKNVTVLLSDNCAMSIKKKKSFMSQFRYTNIEIKLNFYMSQFCYHNWHYFLGLNNIQKRRSQCNNSVIQRCNNVVIFVHIFLWITLF